MTVGVSLSVTTREVRLGAAIRISIPRPVTSSYHQAPPPPQDRKAALLDRDGNRNRDREGEFTPDALQLLTPDRMAAFWPRLSKWPEDLGGIGAGRLAPLLLRDHINRIKPSWGSGRARNYAVPVDNPRSRVKLISVLHPHRIVGNAGEDQCVRPQHLDWRPHRRLCGTVGMDRDLLSSRSYRSESTDPCPL